MSNLARKNRHFMTWPSDSDGVNQLLTDGDKVTQAGLFFFDIHSDGTLSDPEASIMQTAQSVKEKWTHINMLLTVKNNGDESVFRALLTDQTAQDKFISEIHRILDANSWCDGIDADLERGPNDLKSEIYDLYQRIHDEVKGRSGNTYVHYDLPPMTGPGETVGPEKWCEYEKFQSNCDSVVIMTYGYAWAGSAPGPTTPIDWLKEVLSYAVDALDPMKIFTGSAVYGYRWEIYDYPSNLGDSYRGSGGGFDPFLRWMLGDLSHTDQYRTGTETQAYVPFASFYDSENYVHELYLHIYDYPGAGDEDSEDMNSGTYGGKDFLTAYDKSQKTDFSGIIADQKGTDYVQKSGAMGENTSSGYVYPRKPDNESDGYAKWSFQVDKTGTYDIVCQVEFPWWDEQLLSFKLDGTAYNVGNVPKWYPYNRKIHWYKMTGLSLSAGAHNLELFGSSSDYGTIFYGFRVAASFTEEFYGGEATFTMHPRNFLDRDRNTAWPHLNQFKLTPETLRRDPENVNLWYDDFKDWAAGSLPSSRYEVISGSWTVKK